MQSRGNGVRRGTKTQFPESTKNIKGHDLILGSVLFLVKSAPSPRFRINPYLQYDINSGKLHMPENLLKTVQKLDTLIEGKVENNKIVLLDDDAALDVSTLVDETDDVIIDAVSVEE